MGVLFADVVGLCTHLADVYKAQTVTADDGGTSLTYALTTMGVLGLLTSGDTPGGQVQQTQPGFRILDRYLFLTALGAPVHERDRLLIEGAYYDVLYIRTVHDDEGPSYLQIRLARAAVAPFLTPGGI